MPEWLCGFALIARIFCSEPAVVLSAYIEGEVLFIAPVDVSRIDSIDVRRGDEVQAGSTLVHMESDDARFAVLAAEAGLAEAKARLANLSTGKRAEEIAVIEANRSAARADLAQAELDLKRATELVGRKLQSQSALDQARTARNVALARLNEAEASLQVAEIAARVQEIEAARRVVEAAQARLDDAQWRLEQRVLSAPAGGRIEEILRYPGETAGPGAPVLSLLPPERRKLKMFLPQSLLPQVPVGRELSLSCDSCGENLRARVNFIASGPEFTPPVIYSVESRQKLVVLVEAELLGAAASLQPGQIVDVTIPQKGGP